MKLGIFGIAALTAIAAIQAEAADKVRVVTTLPDLAEAARDVGGDLVEANSLLSGGEDPHYMDALPSFVRALADADVVCSVGLELEVGWLPKALARTGEARVQPGGSGYCETGTKVSVIEKPTGPVDRSMGDVHPNGNPHFNLSPKALGEAADAIAAALSRARPEEAARFDEGLARFKARMNRLADAVGKRLRDGLGENASRAIAIEYHREFAYFFNVHGLKSYGALEEKPGVPPSAARLAKVASGARAAGVRLAMGSLYSPEKQLAKFSELSGVPYQKIPTMVQTRDKDLDTIEKLQNRIADRILAAAGKATPPGEKR